MARPVLADASGVAVGVGVGVWAGAPMIALDAELDRLMELDRAVANYLSHLHAYEQGAEHDETPMTYWRDEMQRLTDV